MWIFYSHGSLCPNFLACEHWFLVRSCSWAFEATGNLLVKPFFMSVSRIQTKRRQRKKCIEATLWRETKAWLIQNYDSILLFDNAPDSQYDKNRENNVILLVLLLHILVQYYSIYLELIFKNVPFEIFFFETRLILDYEPIVKSNFDYVTNKSVLVLWLLKFNTAFWKYQC